jgi:sialic acid synthase SpsE
LDGNVKYTEPSFEIGGRRVGPDEPPLVIAEIGINHEGDFEKAVRMVDDAAAIGCECVKFQCHVIEDEMIPAARDVIPGNADESIWDIMERCALAEEEDRKLKERVEAKGMIYISTPFSRAAADRLRKLDLSAYKIGSGECNNYPLVEHIAAFGKPVILSTGMNDLASIQTSVDILRRSGVPFALMHCTSIYPTPYEKVRLRGLQEMATAFPDAVLGLSDHSIGNYTCLAAVALGASLLEKHYTSDRAWPGPDVAISIDPEELGDLIRGSRAVRQAMGGGKTILPEEQPTIDFAYACVVAIRDIEPGERLTRENAWVKRPGTGEIKAVDFERVLGKKAKTHIAKNDQVKWAQIDESSGQCVV